MKKRVFSITILALIFLFSGCQGKTDVKEGKYLLNGKSDKFSYVLLDGEGNFEFSRGIALSYVPRGTYEVEGERLILKVNEEEEYQFIIEGDELLFQGEIEGVLERGSRFLRIETMD